MLALLSDGGTTKLTISLEASESFQICSTGGTYSLTSNTGFSDSGVVRPSDFSEFGSKSLAVLASGLSRYSDVEIVDSAAGASVSFVDSQSSKYATNVQVLLDSGSAAPITFAGTGDFDLKTLNVRTDKSIIVTMGASLMAGTMVFNADSGIQIDGVLDTDNLTLESDYDGNGIGDLIVSAGQMSSWRELAKVTDQDDPLGYGFGYSIAISGDGTTAVVGEYGYTVSGRAGQGRVSIYTLENGTVYPKWIRQRAVVEATGNVGDNFGKSVAVSDDGKMIIVGAPNARSANGNSSGLAYPIDMAISQGSQTTEVIGATLSVPGDFFGSSVAISGDGSFLFISAPSKYVVPYSVVNHKITQLGSIIPPTAPASSNFGGSLASSYNGATIVIGARTETVTKSIQGAAYTYFGNGLSWGNAQQLVATDAEVADAFGTAVSVSSDGGTVAVGAKFSDPGGPSRGSVYVFDRTSNNAWSEPKKVTSAGSMDFDLFGSSIALSNDGNEMIVGAPASASDGYAVIFIRVDGKWNEVQKISSPSSGELGTVPEFGNSVDLTGDGRLAIVGAPFEVAASADSGVVHTFTVDAGYIQFQSNLSVRAANIDSQNHVFFSKKYQGATRNVFYSVNQGGRAITFGGTESGNLNINRGNADFLFPANRQIGDAKAGKIRVTESPGFGALNFTVVAGNNESIEFSGTGRLNAGSSVKLIASGKGAITSGDYLYDVDARSVELLSGSGGIGTAGNPFSIDGAGGVGGTTPVVRTFTSGGGNQFLSSRGQAFPQLLSAGVGTIELDGGTFSFNVPDVIEDNSSLSVLGATAEFNKGETLSVLTIHSGVVSGSGDVIPADISAYEGTLSVNVKGSTGLSKMGSGTFVISGNNSFLGPTVIYGGTVKLVSTNQSTPLGSTSYIDVRSTGILDVRSTVQGVLDLTPGMELRGSGSVLGGIHSNSGSKIAPSGATGVGPGKLRTGDVVLSTGSEFVFEALGGTSDAYDQLEVNGSVLLSGASLRCVLSYVPSVGTDFTLIDNDGADPVVGTFGGLPEGAQIVVNGSQPYILAISYKGGDGNDVVLSRYGDLAVSILPAVVSESAGSVSGTVRRTAPDVSLPLTIQLSSSTPSRAIVPVSVVIPAGSLSASFPITLIDNDLLDGDQVVSIFATALRFNSSQASLTVLDDETISISLASYSISENGGATVGTLSRHNTELSKAVTVSIANSDPSSVVVPASVTIPAGKSSTIFSVTAIDNSLLDGNRVATITASAAGFIESIARLEVTDAEFLTVTMAVASMSELGGVVQATVIRGNTDIGQPIVVNLLSSDTSEANVPFSVVIPGGEKSVAFTVAAVDDNLFDGTQTVVITASAAGYIGGSEVVQVTDYEVVSVEFTSSSVSESSGSILATIARSNTDVGQAVSVVLASDDTSEATVPVTVVIPAGRSSMTFPITIVDDTLLDGPQSVSISAAASGYFGIAKSIQVLDNEFLTLTIDRTSVSEAGGSAVGTVRRNNTDIDLPITVSLASSDTTEASVPTSIVIPGGHAAATFTISAVDDLLLDGTQTVSVSASAAGYISGSRSIDVTDFETVSVGLTLSSISEKNGTTTATLTRSNTDITLPLTVSLTSSDLTEAVVPASVTIPAGQSQVGFQVTAVDDTVLDGDQLVNIIAAANGYQTTSKSLIVTDYETLSVTFDKLSISEYGGTAIGTVTRGNTNVSAPITISLVSNDVTAVTVPATVVIPAGVGSVSFTLTAVDDSLLDGTQSAVIKASSTGYIDGSSGIQVTDYETLSLSMDVSSMSEFHGSITGTVTRNNSDIGSPLIVNLASADTTEAVVPGQVTIPAGQLSISFPVTAVDDFLLDGSQDLTISAAAIGYVGDSRIVQVTDYEPLTLSFSAGAMSENGGTVTGTVSRLETDTASTVLVFLTSGDTSEATVLGVVAIAAGATSKSFVVNAVDDSILDGTQDVTISAVASGFISAAGVIQVTDYESLLFSLSTSSISENNGTAVGTVTRSNTDIAQPLTVMLGSNDLTELTVPVSVTIPAGQSAASFNVAAVDDSLLDGTQSVLLSVSASGYVGSAQSVQVTDYETLALSLSSGSISEAGGTAVGTIVRSNTDIGSAQVVNLVNSDPISLAIPTVVTIPAGAQSATFAITAIDDNRLDGSNAVSISIAALGYAGDSQGLIVTDYETVSITVDRMTMSERGGTAVATVTRSNSDTAASLQVALTNSDAGELSLPGNVIIPAGAQSVTFSLSAIDDALLDGSKLVHVAAAAGGYIGSSATLEVTDYETVVVTVSRTSISEAGGTAIGTVRRSNTDNASPLTVRLIAEDLSELSVPGTVLIPAGQSSMDFLINAVDDTLLDGTQAVRITASADGYVDGSVDMQVTDLEQISLTVDPPVISENHGTAKVTAARSNTDVASSLNVFIAADKSNSLAFPSLVTIPAGKSSVVFDVIALDDDLLNGTRTINLSVSAPLYVGTAAPLQISDYELLTLSLSVSAINEKGGVASGTVRRGNQNIGAALIVSLSVDDATELLVPQSVTIPAGQASATFNLTAVDDQLLDGTQNVHVSALSSGYVSDSKSIDVTDFERLTLVLDSSSIDEQSGRTTATVTRENLDVAQSLVVNLTSSDVSEAVVPVTVVIPAGQTSASFVVQSVDDNLLDGAQSVQIVASASGYVSDTRDLQVADVELLTIQITTATIREDGQSTIAVVRRGNTDVSNPLQVKLLTSDVTEAAVPQAVTIPANASQVSFVISAVDDQLLDGTQDVQISATAVGYVPGSASLQVLDFEPLILNTAASAMKENGGQIKGTISRGDTNLSMPIEISLTSNDSTAATVPSAVTIPAGQAATDFVIRAVDDTFLDGTQSVTITATASGFIQAGKTVSVLDSEALTLAINESTISEKGGRTFGSITRSNTDTNSPVVAAISTSGDSRLSLPQYVTIPAGHASAEFEIDTVDNSLLDGDVSAQIVVSSTGYESDTAFIQVTDYEELVLDATSDSINENGGKTTAILRRVPSDLATPLTATIRVSDSTELATAQFVVIPTGNSFVSFEIIGVNDAEFDGDQSVDVAVSAPGYIDGVLTLVVLDDDTRLPRHNPRSALDVNADGFVSAIDALLVINHLNSGASPPIGMIQPFLDTNADSFISAIDALFVINYLNSHAAGEGEGQATEHLSIDSSAMRLADTVERSPDERESILAWDGMDDLDALVESIAYDTVWRKRLRT